MGVRACYVCNRYWGTVKCPTLTLSSRWLRRHEDPLQSQQRWYCPVYQSRYKTCQGVLVQFTYKGHESYVRAEIPPTFLQKVKCAAAQRTYQTAITPEALLHAIPDAAIRKPIVAIPHPDASLTGVYTFNREVFDELPIMNWATWLSQDVIQAAPPTIAPLAGSSSTAPAKAGDGGPGA